MTSNNLPDFLRSRNSLAKAPDYSAKQATEQYLSGQKKTWSEVHYLPASEDSAKRCHECAYYLKPGQPESDCAKVIDVVKAEGVCDLFTQRQYNDKPATGNKAHVTIEVRSVQ